MLTIFQKKDIDIDVRLRQSAKRYLSDRRLGPSTFFSIGKMLKNIPIPRGFFLYKNTKNKV
jgi:hypothetical protein